MTQRPMTAQVRAIIQTMANQLHGQASPALLARRFAGSPVSHDAIRQRMVRMRQRGLLLATGDPGMYVVAPHLLEWIAAGKSLSIYDLAESAPTTDVTDARGVTVASYCEDVTPRLLKGATDHQPVTGQSQEVPGPKAATVTGVTPRLVLPVTGVTVASDCDVTLVTGVTATLSQVSQPLSPAAERPGEESKQGTSREGAHEGAGAARGFIYALEALCRNDLTMHPSMVVLPEAEAQQETMMLSSVVNSSGPSPSSAETFEGKSLNRFCSGERFENDNSAHTREGTHKPAPTSAPACDDAQAQAQAQAGAPALAPKKPPIWERPADEQITWLAAHFPYALLHQAAQRRIRPDHPLHPDMQARLEPAVAWEQWVSGYFDDKDVPLEKAQQGVCVRVGMLVEHLGIAPNTEETQRRLRSMFFVAPTQQNPDGLVFACEDIVAGIFQAVQGMGLHEPVGNRLGYVLKTIRNRERDIARGKPAKTRREWEEWEKEREGERVQAKWANMARAGRNAAL